MRLAKDRIFFGVCSGIANWLKVPHWIIRLAFLAIALNTNLPIIIAYALVAFFTEEEK